MLQATVIKIKQIADDLFNAGFNGQSPTMEQLQLAFSIYKLEFDALHMLLAKPNYIMRTEEQTKELEDKQLAYKPTNSFLSSVLTAACCSECNGRERLTALINDIEAESKIKMQQYFKEQEAKNTCDDGVDWKDEAQQLETEQKLQAEE